ESESSGRKYVNLSAAGQYVQWTLSQPANAIVIRYNMPDASGGGGITANLSFYVNGTHNRDISVTSKYAWVYGGYPWDNNPANGNAHRFYDETRVLLGTTLAAGTVIKLQKDSGDTAAYYNIDLIDMENVGSALTQPANSLAITSYGAVANDANDDTAAFNSVVSAAISQGKSVWLPAGTFILNSRPNSFSGVTIHGAGMWYTVLSGSGASFSPNGNNCKFYDFALFGNTTQRIDSALETGFDGNLGTGSVIQNIWMEHLKCGIWANNGTNGLLVNGCRIRNTFADGINLYNGTKNTTVQNCSLRNTGDDSIAIWSGGGNACTGNIVQSNMVQSPYHANTIAVYGGSGNTVQNNYCYDTVQFGSGVYLANRFSVVAFSGTTTVSGNTLTRCGSWDNDYSLPWGAIKLGAEENNMGGTFTISNNTLVNSLYSGILIIGPNSCNGAIFSNINIITAGTYGIEVRNNAYGSATFTSVAVSGALSGGLNNAAGSNFTINKGSGNSGW
ncbi:MAG TPA: right-handed parallel beta-helix repeat-containing protein, partial [Bacillota bacterium]